MQWEIAIGDAHFRHERMDDWISVLSDQTQETMKINVLKTKGLHWLGRAQKPYINVAMICERNGE